MYSSITPKILLASVFLVSLSSIMFEILLARFFSISQWNHLAFMIISMALFGFAAGGTYLSIRSITGETSSIEAIDTRIRLYILCYSSSTLVSFLILNRLPLDYMELPVESMQIVFLLAACLLIAVPFFYAGMVVSFSYMTMPELTGRVYFFNMAGSGMGALAVMFLLPLANEGSLIILAAILPLLAVLPFSSPVKTRQRKDFFATGSILTCFVALVILLFVPELIQIKPSAYKSLSQLLLFPDTTATHEQTSLRGRVETVDSPYIRFAPGLSLKYQNSLPKQKAAFIDYDNRLVLPAAPDETEFNYQRHTLAYAGYLIPQRLRNILIIQNSGGSAIACALSTGAENVVILEKNPMFTDLTATAYPITVSSENPRSYINNSAHRFDVIHVESWGASLPGASALTQDYSFTIDAFKAYLSRLSQDGVVVVSRRLLLPPSNMLRICAAACEALLSFNVVSPERHIAIIRNWDTFAMIVSLKPLKNIVPLAEYAQKQNFDLVWPLKTNNQHLNRFNAFEKPFHYLSIKELFASFNTGEQFLFFNRYPLDIAPQSDDRPYPDKFFKWHKAMDIHKMTGSRFYTLLLSGEIIVLVVLCTAILTALCLLLIPWFASTAKIESITLKPFVYFLSVGAGFILAELFFIQLYTQVFNDPVVSFAVVLSSLLVFSGLGGLLSFKLELQRIRNVILSLGIVICMMCLFADKALFLLIQLPRPFDYLLAIAALLPIGLLLGIPFPLGMQFMLTQPRQRAYAYAANGCSSVVFSVIAMQIALSIGQTAILWCAAVAYTLAWITAKSKS